MYKKLEGLIAAVFTPFTPGGEINPAVIPEYAARLRQEGVAGVFVNGSSGEGVMLSVEERQQLAEAWVKERTDDFRVVIHVGSTSVRVATALAAHAQLLNADAVACMAPPFFSSSDVRVVADYCRQVAAAAPGLPFYYYHLPVATGAHIKVHQLLTLGAAAIPNLVGVKFTYTDFMDMHQCVALQNGRFDVLHGHDEILINGLVLGVKGAIGTTFNFVPGIYHEIIRAFEANDLATARRFQQLSIQVVSVMLNYVNAIVGGKAIMKLSGIDCGPCRTPLRNLEKTEWDSLEKDLSAIGYFDTMRATPLTNV